VGTDTDGGWLFDGYRMSVFTNDEENQVPVGQLGAPWYVEDALRNKGAVVDNAPTEWVSHVVVDRNVITGQNPASSDAAADAVLKRLEVL
jgi:putative intracellular protease/amidase